MRHIKVKIAFMLIKKLFRLVYQKLLKVPQASCSRRRNAAVKNLISPNQSFSNSPFTEHELNHSQLLVEHFSATLL
jgi:hypothetical protein